MATTSRAYGVSVVSVRVLVMNDFPIVVAGLTTLLKPFEDRIAVLPASSTELQADDVVLYDTFGVPLDTVTQTSSRLREAGAKLVVYSWTVDDHVFDRAVQAGASACLSKGVGPSELVTALEMVHRGEVVLSPSSGGGYDRSQPGDWPGRASGLTARESEVLALICKGVSNKQIALDLYISENSVKTYIQRTYRKIRVTTRTQAALWALSHGFDTGRE